MGSGTSVLLARRMSPLRERGIEGQKLYDAEGERERHGAILDVGIVGDFFFSKRMFYTLISFAPPFNQPLPFLEERRMYYLAPL